uniref:Uncharacterized protein n=1 Tax=Corethron hystrix TaxID=216773 RepID=A0A6U5GAL5_9STRA|mmetsp:Transcript_26210/g.60266  ORF Transcript_26210/g.60266 Transcript_26210/m.60266 type:complete len:449 (+) Transcript_26210:375-1721(+)
MAQRQRRTKLKDRRGRNRRNEFYSAERLLTLLLGVMLLLVMGVYVRFFTDLLSQPKSSVIADSSKSSLKMLSLRTGLQKTKISPPHLFPEFPVLPPFTPVENSEHLVKETLDGKPTVAGIMAILQNFLADLHHTNYWVAEGNGPTSIRGVIRTYFDLAERHIGPLERFYSGRSIFPIRDDDSIFMSFAAYREYLLAETLFEAFGNAANPEKLFIGAVIQQCFGKVDADGNIDKSGKPCMTGVEVVGKNAQGRDMTRVSNKLPDNDEMEEFCSHPNFGKYCKTGQIRVLYVHETESLGPAVARYHASRLWGGETYFIQTDSHLKFAKSWDIKYIAELRAAQNYPKAVLSSYPPGFNPANHAAVKETRGARLCSCAFSNSEIEKDILRINVSGSYRGNETEPRQIPFIAAGFFFARAEFLVDVPFDPYMPWCFMGEEIVSGACLLQVFFT